MNGWAWLIWTSVCIAAACAAVGGALLIALACSGRRACARIAPGDAPRGPCDRCGYDLAGLEGGLCPECAWPYAGNRRLPARRRVRSAAAGAALLIAAAAVAVAPRVLNHGTLSLLPDWALIAALPLAPGGDPSAGTPGGGGIAVLTSVENGSELHRVLRSRLEGGDLTRAERTRLASACAAVIAGSRDEPARLAAASLLDLVGRDGADAPAIVTAGLGDPSARVRGCVVAALARLAVSAGSEHDRRPLVRALLGAAVCDRDPDVRRQAVAALGSIESAAPDHRRQRALCGVLTRAAHDPCPAVRIRTMFVLSTRGPASTHTGAADAWDLGLCTDAVHDPHPGVREAAVFAMARLGGGRADIVALLGRALGDPSRDVREMAAGALARLRGRAASTAAALTERLYDRDPGVRDAAMSALQAMTT